MDTFEVAVLTPSTGLVRMGYAESLAKLFATFPQRKVYPELVSQNISFFSAEGSGIASNREKMVVQALADEQVTHILFIDDDMKFEPEAFFLLASRRLPFVACNYPLKLEGAGFSAVSYDKNRRVVTDASSTGLEEVWFTGFGFALISRELFEAIEKPYFLAGYNTAKGTYTTEDFPFCMKAIEKGFKIYVDHDASKLVSHVGNHTFTWEEVAEFTEVPEPGEKNGKKISTPRVQKGTVQNS